MSRLRQRQDEAARENEQRTRRVDAEDAAKAAAAERELAAKVAAAHPGKTKQEQVRVRHANMPSNAGRGRG